ncbi:MAG: hypothetical protein KC503_33490 [Myxococcales bacterium]|nr:hypothetical protein [Myxococcales bacterium]
MTIKRLCLAVSLVVAASACNDPSPPAAAALSLLQPHDGELVRAGARQTVIVSAPEHDAADLAVSVQGAQRAVDWRRVDEGWAFDLDVPSDAGDEPLRIAIASAKNARPVRLSLVVRSPRAVVTAKLDGSATQITEGALTIELDAGAVDTAGEAELAAYTPSAIPAVVEAGVAALSDVYRLHLTQLPAAIKKPLRVTLALDAQKLAELDNDVIKTVSLRVIYDTSGADDDPDSDGETVAARALPAEVRRDASGSAQLVAELPPQAFTRSGSSSAKFLFTIEQAPLRIRQVQLCEQGGSGECVSLPHGALQLEQSGRATKLTAEIDWTSMPPATVDPLASIKLNSPFNPYREFSKRMHLGVDLKAIDGTPALAVWDGDAVAVLRNEDTGMLSVSLKSSEKPDFTAKYLHVSDVTGFTAEFKRGERIGERFTSTEPLTLTDFELLLITSAVYAPVSGTYTLACRGHALEQPWWYELQYPNRTLCSVTVTSGGTTRTIDQIYRLRDGKFRRQVKAGEELAKTGRSGTKAPHLHYEVHYTRRGSYALDPSLFHTSISSITKLNPDGGAPPRSPAMRFGAAIAGAVIRSAVLGVDEKKQPTELAQCPVVGGDVHAQPVKLLGPGNVTRASFELGRCLHDILCGDAAVASNLDVTFGAQTYWAPGSWEKNKNEWAALFDFVADPRSAKVTCSADPLPKDPPPPPTTPGDWTETTTADASYTTGPKAGDTQTRRIVRSVVGSTMTTTTTTSDVIIVEGKNNQPGWTFTLDSVSTVTKSYDGQQTITTVTRVQQTFVNQNGDGKTNSTDNTTTQTSSCPTPATCRAMFASPGLEGPLRDKPRNPTCRWLGPGKAAMIGTDGSVYKWTTQGADHTLAESYQCSNCGGKPTSSCQCVFVNNAPYALCQ